MELEQLQAEFPDVRALLVEDYIPGQEMVKEMLENMECEVDTAKNGAEAEELYLEHRYDIIFLDIHMPGMNGYEVAKKIRLSDGDANRTPIIAITADITSDVIAKFREAGISGYIEKPIRMEDLELKLGKYFS